LNIENCAISIHILIARLSPHYDEVSLEDGLIEIDLDTAGNEQPPDTRISAAILVTFHEQWLKAGELVYSETPNPGPANSGP
jgi:hypothetical protein